MNEKDKAQQDAMNIANRKIQPTNDLIIQCLLSKNYGAASLHLKKMKEAVSDLEENIKKLDK